MRLLHYTMVIHSGYNFSEHTTDTWEKFFIDKETQITYMLGALVCERTLRLYGKEKLFEILKSKRRLFETLADVGLSEEILNDELRREIKYPFSSPFQKKD